MCSGIVHSDGSALGPTAGVKWVSEARGEGTGIAGWCLDTRTGLARNLGRKAQDHCQWHPPRRPSGSSIWPARASGTQAVDTTIA